MHLYREFCCETDMHAGFASRIWQVQPCTTTIPKQTVCRSIGEQSELAQSSTDAEMLAADAAAAAMPVRQVVEVPVSCSGR